MKNYSKPFIEEEILELEDIIAASNTVYDINSEPADLIDPEI